MVVRLVDVQVTTGCLVNPYQRSRLLALHLTPTENPRVQLPNQLCLQSSERLTYLGIIGAKLRALLKPLTHHYIMTRRGLSEAQN